MLIGTDLPAVQLEGHEWKRLFPDVRDVFCAWCGGVSWYSGGQVDFRDGKPWYVGGEIVSIGPCTARQDGKTSSRFAPVVSDRARNVALGLRRARTRAGLTQQELAERLGTTQSVIARWEGPRGFGRISVRRALEWLYVCDETAELWVTWKSRESENVPLSFDPDDYSLDGSLMPSSSAGDQTDG